MIPNLNAEQHLNFRRMKAVDMTKKAIAENDALSLMSAAEIWDEVGEAETAKRLRALAQTSMWLNSTENFKFIIPNKV